MERVAITGAHGTIGRALSASLRQRGVHVIRIGRQADCDLRWEIGKVPLEPAALEGVGGVVNLAGAPIDRRWTRARREAIVRTRVDGTSELARVLASLRSPPRALVSASAMGFYGDRGDEILDETSERGTGFLAEVVAAWEAASTPAKDAGIRVVNARMGVVLASQGGALARMLPFFRAGVGATRVGSGKQWLTWIALRDAVRGLRFLLEGTLSGAVNVTAPQPVRNRDFVHALGRALRRPSIVPAPAFALRLVFGRMVQETLLASQRVLPRRLLGEGFSWEEGSLEAALAHIAR
jgi:uncharacterized protein (TIGR01777 family)